MADRRSRIRSAAPRGRERARSLGAELAAEPDATPRIVEILERVGAKEWARAS